MRSILTSSIEGHFSNAKRYWKMARRFQLLAFALFLAIGYFAVVAVALLILGRPEWIDALAYFAGALGLHIIANRVVIRCSRACEAAARAAGQETMQLRRLMEFAAEISAECCGEEKICTLCKSTDQSTNQPNP